MPSKSRDELKANQIKSSSRLTKEPENKLIIAESFDYSFLMRTKQNQSGDIWINQISRTFGNLRETKYF